MNEEQENKDSHKERNRHIMYPVILIVIGVIFLLTNYGYLQGEGIAWGKIWPVFLIIPGLFMLFRPKP